jgi:PST family polysaccharide transporter
MSNNWFQLGAQLRHWTANDSIARNSGWLIADKAVRGLLGLPLLILLPRYLGAEQFGQLSYALAWLALFSVTAGLGLDRIAVHELVRQPGRARAILSSIFAIKATSGTFMAAATIGMAVVVNGADAVSTGLISVLAGALLFQAMDWVDYWFQSRVASKYAVLARLGGFLAGVVVKLCLIAAQAPLAAFALAQLIEAGLIALLLYITYFRQTGTRISAWALELSLVRRLLKEAAPLAASALVIALYMRLDVLMLERMSAAEEVGIYSAAVKLTEIWYALPLAWMTSTAPSLLSAYTTDPLQFRARLAGIYRVLFWISCAASAATVVVARPLILVLYGEPFAESATVLGIYTWASIPVFLGVASSQYLLAAGLQHLAFIRTAIGLAANITLNLVLIPRYEAAGAAAATVISYIIATYSIVFFKIAHDQAMDMIRAPFKKTSN